MAAGGDVRPGEQCFVGPLAERLFDDFRFDTFILSVGGVDAEHGLTDFDPDSVRLKQAAARSARRRVVVADSATTLDLVDAKPLKSGMVILYYGFRPRT